ncbi:hypothetical protein [Alkalimarinus coralli]|uniref:hypothetical protein n=1 Tax=Alkalimarinus coralli TaxID=2935863 RepID=UPI00202AE4A2|nr:hypothetical protein [Alkalimarinus coralli]
MKIKIEKTNNQGDEIHIDFLSDYGRGSAIWAGEIPTPGAMYDVEIEIDDDLLWGENISTTTKNKPTIAIEKDMLVVAGKVIKLEKNGCLSIAVGDSIILLDVESPPEEIVGLIEFRASDVKVYSTNL